MSKRPTIVAHRAGNRPAKARAALDRADAVEIDLHLFRRRLEVRHAKVLWPTSLLWERWFFLPGVTEVPTLEQIAEAVPPDTHLCLDLKMFTGRPASRIRAAVGEERPLTVSSRNWWVLRSFRSRPGVELLRSCSGPRQLALARRLPGLGERLGIVAHERLLDSGTVQGILDATPLLYTWGVPSAERGRELADLGVAGLIVDDLTLSWPRAR